MNYSTCKRLASAILGPRTRVWRAKGQIFIGIDEVSRRLLFGMGPDYLSAFRDAFVEPEPKKDE